MPQDKPRVELHSRVNNGRDRIAFLTNYAVIALLNAPQFALTIYGRRKLDTDANYDETNGEYDDYLFDNWNGLKLCLAVACMTWVFLLYGLIRWFKPKSIPYFESIRGWDRVIHTGIIWVLQLAAAAVQVGFVGKHLHCQEECAELNGGSRNRNIAYAVLAWLLWFAWCPQLIWVLWSSRRA